MRLLNQSSLTVIAEVGNQFNGDLDTALRLVDAAAEAGADAVKFIFWFPDEIFTDKNIQYTYDVEGGAKTEPMFDLLDRIRLPLQSWQEVLLECNRKDIMMSSTVISPSGFEMATELGLSFIKLSTWDWNFSDLWRWVALSRIPAIADLGAVKDDEIEENINIFRKEKNYDLAFLHCFHTKRPEAFNMLTIPYMRNKYNCLVGYSSADRGNDLDVMAVTLGASILEKRLTLDRKGGVLHDAVSLEPDEFKDYVTRMRKVKASLGESGIFPSEEDTKERQKWFRRIVADEFIPKGEIILRQMLEAKRGLPGIPPSKIWDFVGKTAARDIQRNETIQEYDVDGL